MTSPGAVLAAVDFGDASARAVGAAGLVARRWGNRPLLLLHAEPLDAPVYFTHEQIESLEAQRRSTRHQAEEFLKQFGRRLTTHPFTAIVDDRPPVDAIVHASHGADLVVMGTHGRHGPQHWWLGSVAERVLQSVSRPLLVVRAGPQGADAALFERILVVGPQPPAGQSALELARTLERLMAGRLVEAHAAAVEAAVEETNASLVVVAAPQRRDLAWLSGVGEPLIQRCTRPVLFVPEQHA